jgi:hypothetical protein
MAKSGVRVCSWHRVRHTRSRWPLSAWEPPIVYGGRELPANEPQMVTTRWSPAAGFAHSQSPPRLAHRAQPRTKVLELIAGLWRRAARTPGRRTAAPSYAPARLAAGGDTSRGWSGSVCCTQVCDLLVAPASEVKGQRQGATRKSNPFRDGSIGFLDPFSRLSSPSLERLQTPEACEPASSRIEARTTAGSTTGVAAHDSFECGSHFRMAHSWRNAACLKRQPGECRPTVPISSGIRCLSESAGLATKREPAMSRIIC